MQNRERLLAALNHKESDHVPFDLGSTQMTGISSVAYTNLRNYLKLPAAELKFSDVIQQLALPPEDMLLRLKADVRGLFPRCSHNWNIKDTDAGDYWEYRDEWGLIHHRPKQNGFYYSLIKSPLDGPDVKPADLLTYPWPDLADPRRLEGLTALAQEHRKNGFAVMVKDNFAGIFEMSQRLRGMANLLEDMAGNEIVAEAFFDKMLELKLKYWGMVLPALAGQVDVISMSDDYGTQVSQLISPAMFRALIKPRLKTLLAGIKKLAPKSFIFFHSCGNVRPIIPDLIEMGVHILNPVHINAKGMDPKELKRDFGKDVVFWGGGVDTQEVLPLGTPQAIKDHVAKNIEALAPGGGFVFAAVHNIQPEVPPQNIMAMWEAWQKYGAK